MTGNNCHSRERELHFSKIKNKKGITLIALVITIIILLILAGITIGTLTGENGLFEKIKQVVEKHKKAEEDEQEQLDEFYKQLGLEGQPPANTPDTEAGTVVALEEGWGIETVNHYKTTDGTEVKGLTKVSTVYAVSVGNGDTIPVPKDFYYVGGNLDNGVIISDNEQDKYDGKIDKTSYNYTRNLKGNQFVWIPSEVQNYKKTNWGKQDDGGWDNEIPKSELTQIEKYGGFYVARYEAGLASTIPEFETEQLNSQSNQIYNKNGVPQSKAGLSPWIMIDWTHSRVNAESMYNNNYISSGLITGTQWDVILNTMINKTELTSSDIIDNSSAWGNLRNNTISYSGRKATGRYVGSGSWKLSVFSSEEVGTTSSHNGDSGDLLTTGASATTEKYHIFDISGNVREFTEEFNRYKIYRGACYSLNDSTVVCERISNNKEYHDIDLGFRVVLYIK